jgi:hypothetical protein
MAGPKWNWIMPAAAAVGFLLLGFWGLFAGPVAAIAFFAWKGEGLPTLSRIEDEERRLAAFMTEAAAATVAAAPVPRPVEPDKNPPDKKPAFAELKSRAAELAGKERFAAYASARLAMIENARDAHAAAQAALISRHTGEAARAIGACLANGQGEMAAAVFAEFVEQRASLGLAPAQWEALGRALLARQAFMEAAWTLHAGALMAKDPVSAQKRLIEVAGKAGQANQPAVAVKLYGTLLAKYPASQYADFVRANIKLEEKKLAKG